MLLVVGQEELMFLVAYATPSLLLTVMHDEVV